MTGASSNRDGASVLIACGLSWMRGSVLFGAGSLLYAAAALILAGDASWNAVWVVPLLAAPMMFVAMLCSLPFMVVVGAPLALAIGRFCGPGVVANTLAAAGLGLAAGAVLVTAGLRPYLPGTLASLYAATSTYGAVTGFTVTRMIHA